MATALEEQETNGTLPPQKPSFKQTFRALSVPNYRLFWTGQAVSMTGTWMQTTGLAWLVLKMTDSALALGTMTTIQFFPILLFSLFGGVLADRFPKRAILVGTQSVLAFQALAMAILVFAGVAELWQLYILAAVKGVAQAIDNPVRQSFVVEMVGPADLPNAIALNSSQGQLSRLVGPALGGIAIPIIGVSGCFFFNAASYAAVLGGLFLMNPAKFFPSGKPKNRNMLLQIGEGVKYSWSVPDIMVAFLTMFVLGIFGYNFQVLLPLVAEYVLHTGPEGFGILTSSLAVGSLMAALSVAYLGKATRRMLLLGAFSFSISLMLLSASHWWLVTIPILIALGYSSSVFTATNNSRLQLLAPGQLRGRVMSINTLLFTGSTPIGSLIIGFLADKNGVPATALEVGTVCLFGVAFSTFYAYRHRDRMVPEDQIMDMAFRNTAGNTTAVA
jgi:MFS family permease